MDLSCSLGLSYCNNLIDYTKEVGRFLSWQQLLSMGAIIFAATQFMESTKLRKYIFRFGKLRYITFWLVGIPIFLVITANIIQLTNSYIPLLNYPAFYELIALTLLSILILSYLVFLVKPKMFLPKFGSFIKVIRVELVHDLSDESLAALAWIIGDHLEEIIKSASELKKPLYREVKGKEVNPEADEILDFIDVDLSTPSFVRYVARNDGYFVTKFFESAEKYKLWESGGGIFVNRLAEALFTDENSLLSKELMFGGFSGAYKPLTNRLFSSDGIITHYRILDSFKHWTAEISITTLENWTNGLEAALKNYFAEERNIYFSGTPNVALSYSLQRLADSTGWIVSKINKYEADDVWDNEYGKKLSIIGRFFNHLDNILIQEDPDSDYKPVLSEKEQKVEDKTVTEGVAKALFTYFEAFTWMENEEYARVHAIEPMWVLFGDKSQSVLQNIRLKILDLIKERVTENQKGRYPSIIRLLLIIYNGTVHEREERIIDYYVHNEFTNSFAPQFLKDKKFREKHMPGSWFIKDGKIYRKVYDKTALLFPTKAKKVSSI